MVDPSIAIAERLIRLLTANEHASAIVGDLMETRAQRGAVWFWSSVLRVIWSLLWRPFLAFLVSTMIGSRILNGLQLGLFGVGSHRPQDYLWQPIFSVLMLVAVVLWMAGSYGIVCYGIRDGMTQLALLSAGLLTMGLCGWWLPGVLVICIAASAFVAFGAGSSSSGRRKLVALVTTIVVGWSSLRTVFYMADRYRHFLYPGPMGSAELQALVQAHPSIQWLDLFLGLSAVWFCTATFAHMHRWSSSTAWSREKAQADHIV